MICRVHYDAEVFVNFKDDTSWFQIESSFYCPTSVMFGLFFLLVCEKFSFEINLNHLCSMKYFGGGAEGVGDIFRLLHLFN